MPNLKFFNYQALKKVQRPDSALLESPPEECDYGLGQVPDSAPPSRPKRADGRASTLQRVTSDESLPNRRSLSIVPSLGDDTRFEHVQNQASSDIKAIRDAMADAELCWPTRGLLSNMHAKLAADIFPHLVTPAMAVELEDKFPSRTRDRREEQTSQPAHSPKSRLMFPAELARHPHLARALDGLTGDVVLMGGYRGSILRSAESGRQLWVPIKLSLRLRKVDLTLGLDPVDEANSEDTVYPDGMLTHISPIDVSRRLLRRLEGCENAHNGSLRVHNYGYDWRLSPHILADKFLKFIEALPCNQADVPLDKRGATVIAHSLGGLITRHVVNRRPELFAGVLYVGTPQSAVNILGPLRFGDDVGFNAEVLTAQVNFSIRTSFALLPLDGRCFLDRDSNEELPVDFFDPNDWVRYAWSPCISRPTPAPVSSWSGALNRLLASFGRKKNGEAFEQEVVESGMAPQMVSAQGHARKAAASNSNPATLVTIPAADALTYLTRTLAEVKRIKTELAHDRAHRQANLYPPHAVLFGKSEPTVCGAKVAGRDGIGRADAYDKLAFQSGDGVVLARAAMLPEGYEAARGGIVASGKGHVGLLGDLDGVGRCLRALQRGRRLGVGLGVRDAAEAVEEG